MCSGHSMSLTTVRVNLTLKQPSQAGDVSSTELNTIDFQYTSFPHKQTNPKLSSKSNISN
jgi:hypothetical protein